MPVNFILNVSDYLKNAFKLHFHIVLCSANSIVITKHALFRILRYLQTFQIYFADNYKGRTKISVFRYLKMRFLKSFVFCVLFFGYCLRLQMYIFLFLCMLIFSTCQLVRIIFCYCCKQGTAKERITKRIIKAGANE